MAATTTDDAIKKALGELQSAIQGAISIGVPSRIDKGDARRILRELVGAERERCVALAEFWKEAEAGYGECLGDLGGYQELIAHLRDGSSTVAQLEERLRRG